jgi:hypothetical protein
VSSWTNDQVREFAKRFAGINRPVWPVLVDDIREAIIDSFVLLIVLGQDRGDVQVEEIRSMRTRLAVRLAAHHKMPNPTADLVADNVVGHHGPACPQ